MKKRFGVRMFGRASCLAIGVGMALTLGAPAVDATEMKDVPMLREGPAAPTPWKRYGNWTSATWDKYNTLDDMTKTPPGPKQGEMRKVEKFEGDAENGRKLAFDRNRGGGCLPCHVMGPKTQEMPGNVGPDLSEVGKTRDAEFLFNQVWDARIMNPDTVMPPWGAHGYYNEAEIKDIVAFLLTLKEPAVYKNPLDNPTTRPLPVEDRDWRDPFVNPAAEAIERGGELYKKAGANGKSCASCHDKPETRYKTWSTTMPKYDAKMKRMIGIEEFVYRHAADTMGAKWLMQSKENLDLAVYLRSLSNGEKVNVDTKSAGAKEAYERAQKLVEAKVGQGNFACVDCHEGAKGGLKWIRGQYLGELPNQITHFPVWRTSRNEIWDIRKRFQWCNVQIRANELPPDAPEYADLELYVTAASNGMPMEVPGIRH